MQHFRLNKRLGLSAAVTASLFLAGCVSIGPRGLELSRTEFNSAIQRTDGEQLLLNIVRQRYNDPVMFLEVASVSSSISRTASLNLSGFFPGGGSPESYNGGVGGSYSDSPLVFYSPNTGERFVRQILTPIDLRTISLLLQSGWSIERVLLVAGDSFAGLKNTTTGAGDYQALVDHLRTLQRADQLIPASEPGGLIELQLANGGSLKSKTVILSTGARWREMNVPGEQEYRGKGVAYCPHCDGPLFKGKRVAVIGGGNSGVEAAIDLAGVVGHVTVVEFADQLKADAVLVAKLKSLGNASIVLSAQTTEILGDGKTVTGLVYKDRLSGESHTLALQGVFVQIGLVPNTEWLKGTIELSRFGEIVVDHHGATSAPGVFAAGDATTVPYKQIVIAAGDGAKAALGAFDYLIRTPLTRAAA